MEGAMEGVMTDYATPTTMTPNRRSTTDELLAEAVQLATEVRSCVVADPGADIGADPTGDPATARRRLRQVAKVGELTALLGHAVAWLLVRKAVEAGELTCEEGRADERRLGGMPTRSSHCADKGAGAGTSFDSVLDPALADLDRRVQALHGRLARLDRLLDAVAEREGDHG